MQDPPCTQNTCIYVYSCMQYVICCMCFSISKPFRKSVHTNPIFLACLMFLMVYQTYLLFYFDSFSQGLFELVPVPMEYREIMGSLVAADLMLTYAYEKLFIGWFSYFWNNRRARKREEHKANLVENAKDSSHRGTNFSVATSRRSSVHARSMFVDEDNQDEKVI